MDDRNRRYERFRISRRIYWTGQTDGESFKLEGREWGFWSHWYMLGVFDTIEDAEREMRDKYVYYPRSGGVFYYRGDGEPEIEDLS